MKKTFHLYQVDAFTRQPFTGNPAGVVTNADGLTAAQMQSIAREMNDSETAFILAPEGQDHDVHLRFLPRPARCRCGGMPLSLRILCGLRN